MTNSWSSNITYLFKGIACIPYNSHTVCVTCFVVVISYPLPIFGNQFNAVFNNFFRGYMIKPTCCRRWHLKQSFQLWTDCIVWWTRNTSGMFKSWSASIPNVNDRKVSSLIHWFSCAHYTQCIICLHKLLWAWTIIGFMQTHTEE